MNESLARLDPARTALMVMDYQAGILGQLESADALVATTAAAIAAMRRRGGTIGYVRVAFTDADVAALPETNMMRERVQAAGGALGADAPATAVDARLAPQPGDLVVRKTRVGPFTTTDLDEQLRARNIDTLLLAGLSTSGVVLSTVREGADRDYRLIVIADACADPQPDVHAFLVERIFPRQAFVIEAAALKSLL